MIDTLGFQRTKKISRLYSKLEPIKDIKPTKKQINVPQSTCILQIIDDLIRKFEIIEYFDVITSNEDLVKNAIQNDLNDRDPSPRDIYVENIEQTFILMCRNHRSLLRNETNLDRHALTMLIQNSTKDVIRVMLKRSKLFEMLRIELNGQKIENTALVDLIGELKNKLLIIKVTPQKYISVIYTCMNLDQFGSILVPKVIQN